MTTLEGLCKSSHSLHLESGLQISSVLSEYATAAVERMLPVIYQVIGKCLGSDDSALQVAALKATTSFIVSLQGKSQDTFIKLIPSMFQVVGKLAASGNDDPLCECIDEIASLVSFKCSMFRPLATDIVRLLAKTASAELLEAGSRRTALSLIVEFAKKDRTAIKQVNIFIIVHS